MTTAERQARLRARRAELGIIQVAVWVPVAAAASVKLAAERMVANPELFIDVLRHRRTGKLIGRKATSGRDDQGAAR